MSPLLTPEADLTEQQLDVWRRQLDLWNDAVLAQQHLNETERRLRSLVARTLIALAALAGAVILTVVVLAAHETTSAPSKPRSFIWFNRTWDQNDRRAFELDAFRHGHTRVTLTKLYENHAIVRQVFGIAV